MNIAGLQSALTKLRWNPRWSLWVMLVALVVAMLGTLIWLAGRYEGSLIQTRLDRDTAEIATDIRTSLTRNVQGLQALQASERDTELWRLQVSELLRQHREILRIEWRDPSLKLVRAGSTAFRPSVFDRMGRASSAQDTAQACATAVRVSGAAYSSSYFMPQKDGLGMELLDLCIPLLDEGELTGYTVATYSLQDILSELVSKQLSRGQGLSFTEADGTRLAISGTPTRGTRIYSAQQLLDLPGTTLVLRLDSWHGTPDFFPNVLTALVSAMALALIAVLLLLGRDMRRRLKAESDLAEALAFRKAMEDSLVTGLRARDLQGRITYVNPAFCEMVGVDAKELLDHNFPSPYWPPELASAYQDRQTIRLASDNLPRGGHESIFMRRDGTRFPVLIIEAPLINATGKHTGWMSAILDISEQRRIEEVSRTSQDRLQATARLAMVGEMASLLSHELNQPLAAISSYATGSLNLIGDARGTDTTLSADLRLALKRISEQAERAGKVIKSVHDFVRRRDQVREPVAPRALLDAIMPLVSLQARKLSVRVVIEVDPACAVVLCDRTMVEQVLLNLARNGMQAMQTMQTEFRKTHAHERVLTLRVKPAPASETNRWVEFSVTDQGVGISAEVAEKLFTPFFTTRAEGMGLGLSLCRTVIEQHGGYLGHEAAKTRGTIFRFTLPSGPMAAQHSSELLT
ncbi:MAG: PAS domain S-box protein [Polaromonas sp.]|nr:PAS domain S-box protein [Polaromonas sp.]